MFTTAIIAFREFLEAFLIVGVFLGISKKLNLNKEREIAFASTFSARGGLHDFLEQVALAQSHDMPHTEQGVNLMTIHLAKGLEFEAVFIAGCNEGTLPHHRSYGAPEGLEEERRLMYVALTRAAKHIFVSFTTTPSRFLSEIPGNLIEFVNNKEKIPTQDEEESWIEYA